VFAAWRELRDFRIAQSPDADDPSSPQAFTKIAATIPRKLGIAKRVGRSRDRPFGRNHGGRKSGLFGEFLASENPAISDPGESHAIRGRR
jgi:hypothetical protein